MKRFLKRGEIDFDEYVQTILIGALVVVVALGFYTLFLATLGIRDIVLSCMALIMNGLLCSIQFYVLFKIFDFERDHINHYDVEKSMRNLLLPEQAIQIFLTLVHAMNSSWMLTSVQLPFALWHAYCVLAKRPPIKAVIGKSEEFARSVSNVQKLGFVKAGFYSLSLVWCYLRIYAMFYPSAPAPAPFTGGWRVELFHTPQLASTPMAFRNLTMIASGTVKHIDMDSSIASAWSAFPRAAALRFAGGARQIPADGISWRFLGRIRILQGGEYTFCTESDDGSLLYLDLNPIRAGAPEAYFTLLVDNDGLHSSMQRCQSVPLQPGEYHAKVTGFEGGGGLSMRLRHRGPDTGGQLVMTESVDPRPGQWASQDGHDGWWLQIFSIPHGTTATPRALDPTGLIGENRQLSAVRMDAEWQCPTLVPRCPDDWFAWRFYGRVEIREPGRYEFCTESDDGSLLHVDQNPSPQGREPEAINYELVVDNDGMHGPQTRCGSLQMSAGRYHFRVTGFEGGGSPLMILKHRGPDTGGELVWTRSIDASKGA